MIPYGKWQRRSQTSHTLWDQNPQGLPARKGLAGERGLGSALGGPAASAGRRGLPPPLSVGAGVLATFSKNKPYLLETHAQNYWTQTVGFLGLL